MNVSAQEFRPVHEGVEYAEFTREIAGQPVRMNLLRLDLKKVRLDVEHAMDAAIGTEKTSSIASRHGAVAAINAGFFRLDTSIFAGDSAGFLMVDGEIYSDPTNDRVVLGISNRRDNTEVEVGRSSQTNEIKVGNKSINVSGINRQRSTDDVVIYTPRFHSNTLTSTDGIEIVVRNNRVIRINRERGSSNIPCDGFVLSASGIRADEIRKFAIVGMRAERIRTFKMTSVSHEPDEPVIEDDEDAVAGVPLLIRDGKVDVTWEREKSSKAFVETRHPRTAVAILKDGKFLMITVDGRSESSGGIGLYDLANVMLELGAVDAMNLDGGGSTTMYLDGKVVNHPSDKEGERKVSDAIVVTLRTGKKKS